jgi:hypothetical protein
LYCIRSQNDLCLHPSGVEWRNPGVRLQYICCCLIIYLFHWQIILVPYTSVVHDVPYTCSTWCTIHLWYMMYHTYVVHDVPCICCYTMYQTSDFHDVTYICGTYMMYHTSMVHDVPYIPMWYTMYQTYVFMMCHTYVVHDVLYICGTRCNKNIRKIKTYRSADVW